MNANIQLPISSLKTLRESFHDVTSHFYKDINNLNEASSLIAYNVKRSRDNGWQNVSIPYHDALAVMDQIKDSSVNLAEIFEGTKQTAILADKNRNLAETIHKHPIEKTFERFIKGDISKDDLQAAINKVFSVKMYAA